MATTFEERRAAKEIAEQRGLALVGAAEIIAASPKVDRIVSLLELSGGCGKLIKAIERAKRSAAPKFVTMRNLRPDVGVWAEAADLTMATQATARPARPDGVR